MCDEKLLSENLPATGVTRRQLNTAAIAAAVTALTPHSAAAQETVLQDIDIPTPDGTADCYFAHPQSGTHAGVVIWPDARGMRAAYRFIAERLAASGYAVLVVNPYYRGHRGPVLPEGTDPRQGNTMSVLGPLLSQLSAQTESTDAQAMIEFLDANSVVADDRPIGTLGFCLGGPATFRTAAMFPDRVRAGATFHGVRLVTDAPDSPHRLVASINARYLIAIAEDDDANDPTAKDALRQSFETADLAAEIEVYEGAMHSWTTPDSPVHHRAQAERAWSRLLQLFESALA